MPLGLYEIAKGLSGRPEAKATLEQVPKDLADVFSKIIEDFIGRKTHSVAEQQRFQLDVVKYIETQGLGYFFRKTKDEVISVFLNDGNRFESLMNEFLERFWGQWKQRR